MNNHEVTINRVSLPGNTKDRWNVRCSCTWHEYTHTKPEANHTADAHLTEAKAN